MHEYTKDYWALDRVGKLSVGFCRERFPPVRALVESMSLELFHDTIAAPATAEGRGALAIVRISGADAIRVVSKIVSDPTALVAARSGSSIYTRIPDPGPRTPDIDDVVIHIFRAPRSYTGEDLCEVTAHGSPVISREIVRLLVLHGARMAEPGEFSRRAFFNGKIGLEEAELISIKAEAQSEQELHGAGLALAEKFERLRDAYDKLISLIAHVDAEIDFGDSDQVHVRDFDARVAEVADSLEHLVRASQNRRANAGYFTVALTGPPNVGKSSIFNALLEFERSVVSEVPGTTRDYVEAFIEIDGFRVKLVDTAGVRDAQESVEARGIELGTSAAQHADISFRVTEPSDRVPITTNGTILLHNKIDLDGWNESLCLSARTGEGIDELHTWLRRELRERSGEFSQIRLNESEQLKLESIVACLKNMTLELEAPLLSEELRGVASDLASLLGMNISSDSLSYIFNKMCIGK